MAAMAFQVEVVDPSMGLVIARQLEKRKFKLGPQAALGGAEVRAMAIPPATDTDTAMRDDLYMFRLSHAEEAGRLKVGEIVQLTEWRGG